MAYSKVPSTSQEAKLNELSFFAAQADINPISKKQPSETKLLKKAKQLYQAIVDDQEYLISRIVTKYPDCILLPAPPEHVVICSFTKRQFVISGRNALSLAIELQKPKFFKQMTNIVETEQGITEEWQTTFSKTLIGVSYYYRENHNVDIIIPKKYDECISAVMNAVIKQCDTDGQLSELGQKIFNTFKTIVFPNGPEPLEDIWNIPLLLVAARHCFSKFTNVLPDSKKDYYWIHVIGFLQTLLSPKDAAWLCFLEFNGKNIKDVGTHPKEIPYYASDDQSERQGEHFFIADRRCMFYFESYKLYGTGFDRTPDQMLKDRQYELDELKKLWPPKSQYKPPSCTIS